MFCYTVCRLSMKCHYCQITRNMGINLSTTNAPPHGLTYQQDDICDEIDSLSDLYPESGLLTTCISSALSSAIVLGSVTLYLRGFSSRPTEHYYNHIGNSGNDKIRNYINWCHCSFLCHLRY